MARLDEASKRLQHAIETLESVVSRRIAQGGGGQGGPQGSGADDQALREALNAAKRENAALQQLTTTVSDRLDSAILRLRRLAG